MKNNVKVQDETQSLQSCVSVSAFKSKELKEDILIAEYDGRKFIPYKNNSLHDVKFSTYKECEDYIKEWNLVDYFPELGWEKGLGNYRNNFQELMSVVEKICHEKFNDGSNETSYLRTFGMINEDGDFMVRFNRGSLFVAETLIEATFLAVVDFLESSL